MLKIKKKKRLKKRNLLQGSMAKEKTLPRLMLL